VDDAINSLRPCETCGRKETSYTFFKGV